VHGGTVPGMDEGTRKVVAALPGDGWRCWHVSTPETKRPLVCWLVWSDGSAMAVAADGDGATYHVDPARGDWLLESAERLAAQAGPGGTVRS
jgi:hypothetical protein